MATCEHVTFTDVDEFVGEMHNRGWQGDVQQTSPGPFRVDLALYVDAGFTAVRTRHTTPNLREVQTPAGARTFGIVVPDVECNKWCHQPFDRAILQMMPRSDYVASNTGGHLGYQIAIDDKLIDEALGQLELSERLSRDAHLLEVDSQFTGRVVRHLDTIWSGDAAGHAQAREIVIDDLAELVLKIFSKPATPARAKAPVRSRALRRALDYMEAHLADAITLADVARDTGASRRTLTAAFREAVDLSPMFYLKVIRLNRVRRMLRCADAEPTRIVDAANAVGFWHMGQFARDYRQLFGELPSQTLGLLEAPGL